jgi:hypothetical protein
MEDHRSRGVTYKVVAPLVLAVDPDGHTHHVYEGGVIEWLSDAQRAHFLAESLVEVVGAAPASPAPGDAGDGDKPDDTATKAELIAWLVDNATKPDGSDYTAGALQPHNKDELRGLIDAVE